MKQKMKYLSILFAVIYVGIYLNFHFRDSSRPTLVENDWPIHYMAMDAEDGHSFINVFSGKGKRTVSFDSHKQGKLTAAALDALLPVESVRRGEVPDPDLEIVTFGGKTPVRVSISLKTKLEFELDGYVYQVANSEKFIEIFDTILTEELDSSR